MQWSEIRQTYPDHWLVVEALQAHTTPQAHRRLDELLVVELCEDGNQAMGIYRRLHRQYPEREFYFVHTSREVLDISERNWLGIRSIHATATDQ